MMVKRPKARTLFLLLIWTASALACNFQESMGAVVNSSQPVTFTAKGETDQIWQAAVDANKTYEIVIAPLDVKVPDDGADILVCGQKLDVCPSESVIASAHTTHGGASVRFSVTTSQQIYIHITASIGEKGEELGTFTFQLHEIQP